MAAGFSLPFRQGKKSDYLRICILSVEKCPFYPPGSLLIPSHTRVPKLFLSLPSEDRPLGTWALVTAEDIMVAISTASRINIASTAPVLILQGPLYQFPFHRTLGSQAVPGNLASLQQCWYPEQAVWKETDPLSCIWKTFMQGKLFKEVPSSFSFLLTSKS